MFAYNVFNMGSKMLRVFTVLGNGFMRRYVFIFLAFIVGVGLGGCFSYYKWWPYLAIREVLPSSFNRLSATRDCDGFCQEFFSDPLPEIDLYYKDSPDKKSIMEKINEMKSPRIDIRGEAKDIELGKVVTLPLIRRGGSVVELHYAIDKIQTAAFAYYLPGEDGCGVLIIPGTGHDHSSAIYYNNSKNYHAGIISSFAQCSAYVLIKPNEDFLSIYFKGMKLTENAYLNHLIGRGYSYSSKYITDAIALMQWIKLNYSHSIVTGLSQGGTAAMLVAVETEPSDAIIASGPLKIYDDISISGYNTIVFPGYQEKILSDSLYQRLKYLKTRFLFLYGKREVGLVMDDLKNLSIFSLLKGSGNVRCSLHNGGHIYPEQLVRKYVYEILNSGTTNVAKIGCFVSSV